MFHDEVVAASLAEAGSPLTDNHNNTNLNIGGSGLYKQRMWVRVWECWRQSYLDLNTEKWPTKLLEASEQQTSESLLYSGDGLEVGSHEEAVLVLHDVL